MRLAIVLACLAGLVLPAFAQEEPPLPRPRPDLESLRGEKADPAPDAAPQVSAPAPATAADAVTAVARPPQPVTLTARVTDKSDVIPSGVVWRVFDTKTDTSGQLAMVAKSEDSTAHLTLSPGEYVVHVAYGRAQSSDTLVVADDGAEKTIVLDAGALRLNAAIAGDAPIPVNLLRFDVFESSGGDSERNQIAEGLSANDLVTLNAGTYHIVSYFGSVNAVVRADLRVEPGQLTDAILYHKAAQVSFKLVSAAGGEAIADIDWTIKTGDGATVFSAVGTFPATVLAEGDYLVLAKRADAVFNRQFQVKAGRPQEIEVLTTVY